MSNIKEFNLTLDDKMSNDAISSLLSIDIEDDFQRSMLSLPIPNFDVFGNTFGDVSSSNDLSPQNGNNAANSTDENDSSFDVEHCLKTFRIQRVQRTKPLHDFPTILVLKEIVQTSTIEPESNNNSYMENSIDADNSSQTQTEASWNSSGSEQFNKEFHTYITHELAIDKIHYNNMLHYSMPQFQIVRDQRPAQPIPMRLLEHGRRLLQRLGLPAHDNIQYVNNGNGIVNPNYRMPCSAAVGDCLTCPACKRTFKRVSIFNRHMSQHSNNKRFLCVICGKGFHDLFDLKRHTRTHTGIRPYQCYQCGCGFTQLSSLEQHKSTKHWLPILYGYNERRSKLYICEDCGESTTNAEQLEAHVKNKHCLTIA